MYRNRHWYAVALATRSVLHNHIVSVVTRGRQVYVRRSFRISLRTHHRVVIVRSVPQQRACGRHERCPCLRARRSSALYKVINNWVGWGARDFHGYKLFLTLTSVHCLADIVGRLCHRNGEIKVRRLRRRRRLVTQIPIEGTRRAADERCPRANVRRCRRTLADIRGVRRRWHFLHFNRDLGARSHAVRRRVLQRNIFLRYGCHRQVNGCWLAGEYRSFIVG